MSVRLPVFNINSHLTCLINVVSQRENFFNVDLNKRSEWNMQPALVQFRGIGVRPNKRFCKIGITCTGMHCLQKSEK